MKKRVETQSFTYFYKHIKLVLIYGKKTLSKNIVKERRLKIEDNTLPKSMMVSRGGPYGRKQWNDSDMMEI